jgi:hypothetical protein
MARFRPAIAFALLAGVASAPIAREGGAQDVRCQRHQLVRQVDVEFAQDGDGLPCRVIWHGIAGSDQSRLVWRSNSELDFCTRKARELVHDLIDRGWTCDAYVTASEARSAPAVTVRLEPAAPEADAALPLRTGPEPPEPAGRSRDAAQGPRRPGQALLHAALQRDVARLDQLAAPARGGFEVEMARLGDLNGDDVEDAVALITHRPGSAPPSHHLLAYFFDGQTFQPVARLALAQTNARVSRVELQGIADGVIELVLHVAQLGDPACCPSGRRRSSFVLRDHQFVDAGKGRPGA